MNKFSEKDWKLFRKKISGWQEAYMEKLNREYIALLNEEGDAYIMLSLLREGAITFDDLEDFSDDLKDMMKRVADN